MINGISLKSWPSTDLLINGGTPSGIACALRAAREGLTVRVVNYTGHIGGMLSAGLGLYDTSFPGARAPIVSEVFSEILRYYEEFYGQDSENARLCRENQTFEPHVAEAVFERLVSAEPNITIERGRYPVSVMRSGRKLEAVCYRAFDGTHEDVWATASCFVDASYEGDLLAEAGTAWRAGRESRQEYGEPHAGRIFTRYVECANENSKFPFEASRGLIKLKPFDLTSGQIFPGSTGEGDGAIMAYNYRIFLSSDPDNQRPVPKPERYERRNYLGILEDELENLGKEYPLKSKWLIEDARKFRFRNHRKIPNNKVSWNHGNFPGRNHGYPAASWAERMEILQAHRDHELGLLWFLQNDPEVPPELRREAGRWALAADEFTDNSNFPWEIYVREARRLIGRKVFTELDASIAPGLKRAPVHGDSIAIAEWMMDSHECNTSRQPGSACEGAVLLSELTRPAQVPYRCLLPVDIDNLLVPVCCSATHIGMGTLRVEPTWMHLGESSAIACALAIREGLMPGDLSSDPLQFELLDRGIMITFINEFDMSAPTESQKAMQFFGAKGFFHEYHVRPAEPLDAATAREWAVAYADWKNGTLDPLTRARCIAALAGSEAGPVDASTFRDMLAVQFAARGLVPPDFSNPSWESTHSLTRAAACELLWLLPTTGRPLPCRPDAGTRSQADALVSRMV